ncbi:MAG: hypothetical protein KKI09_00245 [Spirochaetes bacterium]|nr:hypothetical protein [Spirochaetota bacterium]MBU0953827.1 hypothetical protein [Spirochaetota bacterium]
MSELQSALAEFGRRLLLTFGLLTVVQVAFERPEFLALPEGGALFSVVLSGALTEEMLPLIDRSVAVELHFSGFMYGTEGTKSALAKVHTLQYRSLDRRWLVRRGDRLEEYSRQEDAVAAFQRPEWYFADGQLLALVLQAELHIPAIADESAVRALWRQQVPKLVFRVDSP